MVHDPLTAKQKSRKAHDIRCEMTPTSLGDEQQECRDVLEYRKERSVMTERETLKKWLDESSNIVFFGGAGVSTESHIPDFRSTDGLYNQQYDYPPETILSHSFYMRKPEEFYRFYRNKMLFPNAEPNRAHKALARLEEMGKLKAVVTQNIDGLHQKAGSREVLELHGSVLRNTVRVAESSMGWMQP